MLERLIAGASTVKPALGTTPTLDWRAEAFHAIAGATTPVPAVAAAALCAADASQGFAASEGSGAAPGSWVCLATPVHLVAGMTGVSMPQGALQLSRQEAEALAADFNRVFGEAAALYVGRSAELLCAFDRALEVTTHDPEDAAGEDVFGYQPTGTDAARLRQLMSEIEMWLFEHAVNQARAQRAALPITGLWLWGGGAVLSELPAVRGWTAGNDPLFAAFGAQPEFPDGAAAGVMVCAEHPGSAGWPDVESRWLEPASAALRSGRVDQLVLSAGERRFTVGKKSHWRFWRGPRPWWESLRVEGGAANGIQ